MQIINNQIPIIKQIINSNDQMFNYLDINYCLKFDAWLLVIGRSYV
jgi:hypothetical protein